MMAARAVVGTGGTVGRIAMGQINNACAVLLSAQFQKFCRDLHTETADILSGMLPASVRDIFFSQLIDRRKLDSGNPNAGNLGSDFGRFGLVFWDSFISLDQRNRDRRNKLEALCEHDRCVPLVNKSIYYFE
jgi:hypothetical protein